MKKNKEYMCPECGAEDEAVVTSEPCFDLLQTDNDEYEFIIREFRCQQCGATWSEYHRLSYDGYYDERNQTVYEANGEPSKGVDI